MAISEDVSAEEAVYADYVVENSDDLGERSIDNLETILSDGEDASDPFSYGDRSFTQ